MTSPAVYDCNIQSKALESEVVLNFTLNTYADKMSELHVTMLQRGKHEGMSPCYREAKKVQSPPPPIPLISEEKAAVFGNRRYWESYI